MIPQAVLCLLLPLVVEAGHLPTRPRSPAGVWAQAGCGDYEQAISGDRCQSFADAWLVTLDQFKALNPSVDCSKPLVDGQEYCVAPDGPAGGGSATSLPSGPTTTPPPKPTGPGPTPTSLSTGHVSAMPSIVPQCEYRYAKSAEVLDVG